MLELKTWGIRTTNDLSAERWALIETNQPNVNPQAIMELMQSEWRCINFNHAIADDIENLNPNFFYQEPAIIKQTGNRILVKQKYGFTE